MMKHGGFVILSAVVVMSVLSGCSTLTAVTDGIGGVFHGMSDDLRSMQR